MNKETPNYDEINKLEAEILRSRWEAIRYAIEHRGEKGAAAEQEVFSLIRSFLPNEYGMSTGFIIYHENEDFIYSNTSPNPKLTKQLDIIIYDAMKCSPLIRLGSCDIIPIEAVYGYIEIKGCLYKSNIHDLVVDSNNLRKLKRRFYYRPKGNNSAYMVISGNETLSIRSFIICLSAEESIDANSIRNELENSTKSIAGDSFISGMLVLDRGFYFSHSVSTEDPEDIKNKHKVYFEETNSLGRFKWCMIESLSRFHRIPLNCTPALDTYSKNYIRQIETPRASSLSSIFNFTEDGKHDIWGGITSR